MKKSVLLVDSVNCYRSAVNAYGSSVWPDYARLRRLVGGEPTLHAEVLVNDGVSPRFARWLTSSGFVVTTSNAFDLDDRLIARAVALHQNVEEMAIASGDGGYSELVEMLHAIGTRVTVVAVPGSLRSRAGEPDAPPDEAAADDSMGLVCQPFERGSRRIPREVLRLLVRVWDCGARIQGAASTGATVIILSSVFVPL